eukprot:CAMPEP_0179328950 /NCGR_PEP_ID=MMETSP0797-20121207/62846_1 /TAXON_ID=47934 /ORGANISM="Dinophysis acuminata, Strain DAEP01" /LENGTH=44 /DNA_ID= /DNA_START= /DNA_END= /DNA_ORIENTATION=
MPPSCGNFAWDDAPGPKGGPAAGPQKVPPHARPLCKLTVRITSR